jgi:transposase
MPWEISKIEVDETRKRVDIYLEYLKGKGKCPECKKIMPLYDERETRVWRHLDTCEYQTYLHCKIPRTNCTSHGIKTMDVPWSADKIRFTKPFERYAIDLVQATKNRSKSAKLLKLSWDQINGIMQRAVERGLEKRTHERIEHLGIDEKSFLKGQSYATVLTDTDGKRVLDVVQNRDTAAVKEVFKCLNSEQLKSVKAISMDFWQAFINGAEELLANASIVHDKFHIMKYANESVNQVRLAEHKWQKKEKESVLTGTKWLWLKKLQNFTDQDKKKWATLNLEILEGGKAWRLRELLNEFWNCPNTTSARKFFKFWYKKVKHSGLEPVKKVAEMIKKFFENIVTWWKYPITNSFAEGINSVIQEVKTVARGFRNFENYRIAILFFCGKLELYP